MINGVKQVFNIIKCDGSLDEFICLTEGNEGTINTEYKVIKTIFSENVKRKTVDYIL